MKDLLDGISNCIHDVKFYSQKIHDLQDEMDELEDQKKEIVEQLGEYISIRKKYLLRNKETPNVEHQRSGNIEHQRSGNIEHQHLNVENQRSGNMNQEQKNLILRKLQHGGSSGVFDDNIELRNHINKRRQELEKITPSDHS